MQTPRMNQIFFHYKEFDYIINKYDKYVYFMGEGSFCCFFSFVYSITELYDFSVVQCFFQYITIPSIDGCVFGYSRYTFHFFACCVFGNGVVDITLIVLLQFAIEITQ